MPISVVRQYYFLSVVLAFLLASAAQAQVLVVPQPSPKLSKVNKSENDGREYRYLTLSNSLRVLLISDTTSQKSAAALNVHVGSHQNPKQRAGLAHFLEHMLFLGTERYPTPDEYQDFISQHGGENNAYTAAENTNYFFDIDNEFLDSALDRFAQFFIAPLFDAAYVDREKNAVNAEYLAKINDDDRRSWDVIRGLINPEHPAANFAVGNLDTLADQEEHSIRDDLIAFFQNNYSANLMTLVVVGNHSLDDLQKMVESRFALIPNNNKVIDDNYPALFAPHFLPASVQIKPVKEIRELSIIFPVPDYASKYRTKPLDYVAQLIGNESAGSLLSLLKGLGWAEAIRAGDLYSSRHDGLFEISISLTKEGIKAKDQITSAVFDYVRAITQKGIVEWRFTEMQQIAEIDFKYREKQTAIDTAMELAQAMQDYPAQDTLDGPYLYSNFDEELLKQTLGFLRKENSLITLVAPEASTASMSSFYQANYAAVSGIPEVLELKSIYHQKLVLPERNVFIPKNTAVKAQSMLPVQASSSGKNVPALLVNTDQLDVWFLQDKIFRSPKAELNFQFKLPMLNNSLENAARMKLFTALITDQLSEFAYPANVAGLKFEIKANPRGFSLNVNGYTDKQSLLVNKILTAVSLADFSQSRFDKLKDDLIRECRNEDKNLPYSVLAKKIVRLQYLPYWGEKEYIDPLQKTSFDQFKQFSADFLRGAKIETLFYGNLYPQDAIKLSALVEHQLLQKISNKLPQLAKVSRSENSDNKAWLYIYPLEHHDHAVELYVQAMSPSIDDAAHMLLLSQILQSPFYNQLRTEKQLGYIVAVYPMPFKTIEASLFVVQSPNVGAENIAVEMNAFLSSMTEKIGDNFVENKNAVLAQLREPAVSLSEQSDKFWQSLTVNDTSFTRQQELIAAVSRISVESIRKYYTMAFLQKNRQLWLSTEKLENLSDFEIIQNVADYQQKQKGYLFP